ncbi:polyprenyl synthetase [Streptomyces albus subsp. chlorinus]|uniref:polyprenyl synthetase n=1 Tax=Streptomyces albus TaxID=1888 RepID=UPI001570E148|nr:polyprenyl synthetase [Streptomyces albus]NSC20033.1 polyprenyl synthetase [Streptomyces albus subsp. chlorinus]
MEADQRAHTGGPSQVSDALLLAVGAAELAVSGLATALGRVRELLSRADVPELAADGGEELKARGRLVLDRLATGPAHLEVLARQAAARRADSDDAA